MKYQYHKILFLSGVFITLGVSAISARSVQVQLDVPFVTQVPDGNWVLPWSEACEEASITMVDAYYNKERAVKASDAQQRMQAMIDWEKETWNNYQDTDADETVELVGRHASFDAEVKRSPSVDDIQDELNDDRPVIALVNMYELYQEQDQGDSYHVLVITGYNDEKKVFIVNDPAREAHTEYLYDRLMGALHDYNGSSKEADGEPTVIVTSKSFSSESKSFFSKVLDFLRGLF